MSDDVRRTFQNAVAARRDQDYARAVELCDSILSRTGDRPDVLNLKAVVLAESGQIVRARRSILTALESIDQNASAETRSTLCIHAARILAALDLYEEAYTLAGQAANLRPSDPACAYQHARLALLCGDLDKAGELVGTCLEKFSDFGEAHILEAQIAIEAGDRKSAEGSYKAVIAGEPLHARAWAGLAEISRARPGDEWVLNGLRTIHDAGIDSERSPGDWATATFAIADAHARAGAHDRAFEYYRSANRQLAERNSWDIGIWQTRTEHTIHRATRHKQESVPSAESLPLFVVGMPRSGSSLLERMIGAHPGISTSGERESMLHIERYAESSGIESAATGVGLPDDLVLEMRALYRKGMNPREQSLWVCDKANRNFERIGLARRLFPESRIVWILSRIFSRVSLSPIHWITWRVCTRGTGS
jgi:tetratricopeptide (TPR) repeat protein